MMPWFIWKNENSYAKGLLINKLPKIGRGKERYQEIQIPGRAGSLIMLEGEDVYDSYLKECIVITRNDNALRQEIINWLRGEGELVFSNEPDKAYDARIAGEVMFERISNDLSQAKIPFWVEPFKRARTEETITTTSPTTIYNPGDVASRPTVTITRTGNLDVTIAGQKMHFDHVGGTIKVDAEARIITKHTTEYDSSAYYYKGDYCIVTSGSTSTLYQFTASGTGSDLVTAGKREEVSGWDGNEFDYIWPGTFSGEFWKIPVGESSVTRSAGATLVIEPKWRWI